MQYREKLALVALIVSIAKSLITLKDDGKFHMCTH